MRKSVRTFISLLLAVILVFCICPSTFAIDDFDFESVLGGEDGYSYDKFDKAWKYLCATGLEIEEKTYLGIGLITFSEEYGPNPIYTELRIMIANEDYTFSKDVQSVDFLIGDDIYSFKTMVKESTAYDTVYSWVILGPNALQFTEALASTDMKEIAIRVTADDTHYDFDATEYEDFKSFQKYCQIFNDYFVKYYNGNELITYYEKEYPLTINGKTVQNSGLPNLNKK